MDIHAPEKPIHSLKEFATHIAVVTIGILIALALEGVREMIHDRALVRETREDFRAELRGDLDHSNRESARVVQYARQLDQLVADLPALRANHPEQIAARLDDIRNPGYFFADNSWKAALSTGALAHMPTDDIQTYASAFEVIRIYSGLQHDALAAEDSARIFFHAHSHLTPDQLDTGTERILLLQRAEKGLVQVGGEAHTQIIQALKL